jgi:hypothetical protein
VHRPQQRRLVRTRGVELRGHLAAVEADDAVADERNLGQLAREEEHRGAVRGELAQERVDLALGADVDAAGRVEAEQGLEPVREPAGDRHLLLVAAREPADLPLRPGVDRERLDCRAHAAALGADVDRPPAKGLLKRGHGDVLCHRPLGQERLQAVSRHEHDACPDGVVGCLARSAAPLTITSPSVGRCCPERTREELVLALSLERRNPEDLARA